MTLIIKIFQKTNSIIIKLSKFLIKKYKIDQKNILGHSDIAPKEKKILVKNFHGNI